MPDPYRTDTITHGLMAGVTITTIIILVSAREAYLVYKDHLYSRSDFNNYVAAVYKVLRKFLFGAATRAKYTISHLQPNFLAVCDPDSSSIKCSVYVQVEKVCRRSPANRVQTFYSRHSSFGTYCMMFLELYVQAQLCWKWAQLLRPAVQVFLLAFALYVGYTRERGALVAGLIITSKSRPPQSCLEEEELDRKPRLSLTLTLGKADCSHYGYLSPPLEAGPVCAGNPEMLLKPLTGKKGKTGHH
ncbi:hypothetical protein GH733_009295 [Mirounga leonina]|nr:hypothetical protein GH733_009295 [Mirounga leonina]